MNLNFVFLSNKKIEQKGMIILSLPVLYDFKKIKNRFMNRFNETFRTKLFETIELIENNSLIEMVVIIKPQSGRYR
ncbi:MAG: hypothetical protein DRJ10_08615, partial [Bacteroidetes bacterium]